MTWVAPPRMRDTDTPLAEDLPAFERALAAALSAALGAPWHPCDTGRLSWQSVNGRIVDTLSEAATRRAGV